MQQTDHDAHDAPKYTGNINVVKTEIKHDDGKRSINLPTRATNHFVTE